MGFKLANKIANYRIFVGLPAAARLTRVSKILRSACEANLNRIESKISIQNVVSDHDHRWLATPTYQVSQSMIFCRRLDRCFGRGGRFVN